MICTSCGERRAARVLGVCGACLREQPGLAGMYGPPAHRRSRSPLPGEVPANPGAPACRICGNACRPGPGEVGFCGLRRNEGGRLFHLLGSARRGLAAWYYDPLPTNCVASWVCAAGEEAAGFNLAVFLGACSFDCLFCQNRGYQRMAASGRPVAEPEQLAGAVRPDTTCVCYFGGDPSPQLPFALRASRLALERAGDRTLRICWETNGNLSPAYLKAMAGLSLASGGCIKFDLKAADDSLHRALTGVGNRRTLASFEAIAARAGERPGSPLLIASTLLVPGYVDPEEVAAIARFIAALDPGIPYSLLAFHPRHLMRDLPATSAGEAAACLEAALEAGLRQVRLGNVHLLT